MTTTGEPHEEANTADEQAVVGVGSMVMRDDGVGYHAIQQLDDRSLPPETTVTHAGTTAFLALEAMSGVDRAIVVDALALEEPPGTVREFRFGETDAEMPDVTMHDFSFSDALAVGNSVYDVPDEILLVGVVPDKLEPGVELSDTVAGVLPELVSRIEARLSTDQA